MAPDRCALVPHAERQTLFNFSDNNFMKIKTSFYGIYFYRDVILYCREDQDNCNGGNWRMKCHKWDTVRLNCIFYNYHILYYIYMYYRIINY